MKQVEVLFKNGKIVAQGKVIEGFVAVDGKRSWPSVRAR